MTIAIILYILGLVQALAVLVLLDHYEGLETIMKSDEVAKTWVSYTVLWPIASILLAIKLLYSRIWD